MTLCYPPRREHPISENKTIFILKRWSQDRLHVAILEERLPAGVIYHGFGKGRNTTFTERHLLCVDPCELELLSVVEESKPFGSFRSAFRSAKARWEVTDTDTKERVPHDD